MLVLLVALGCPAEQLGIELPPGGAASISPEDAQRDVRGLVRDGRPFFEKRMAQMGFEVRSADGWACGVRGAGRPLALIAPLPDDADAAASGAVLISLAKAWDTLDGPPRETWLCVGEAAPPGEVTRLDRLAPGPLEWGPPIHSGVPDPGRPPERFDFREVAGQARALFDRFGGAAGAP